MLSIAGITLALFGGVQKHSIDQNKVPVRGDIHVVIVGNYNPISFSIFLDLSINIFLLSKPTLNLQYCYVMMCYAVVDNFREDKISSVCFQVILDWVRVNFSKQQLQFLHEVSTSAEMQQQKLVSLLLLSRIK